MSNLAQIPSAMAPAEMLSQAQRYLAHRDQALETAWTAFYDHYSLTIRKYAFKCGITEENIADCLQEVWAELLLRLPTFRLDPQRGQFDSWLFHIVRGKTTNLHRANKRRFQDHPDALQTAIAPDPNPARTVEDAEMLTLVWEQLEARLSACNLQILHMRLVEQRPVAEVAEELGLSNEQVWYRFHRARRAVERVGGGLMG